METVTTSLSKSTYFQMLKQIESIYSLVRSLLASSDASHIQRNLFDRRVR